MPVPVLPESAPFSPAQRAWLNGFFAGVFGLDPSGGSSVPVLGGALQLVPNGNGHAANGNGHAANGNGHAAHAEDEEFPWHDPVMPMAERLGLAEGRPYERRLMAAMAQLDCGSCGYMCQTYAEALANGEDKDASKCVPGGKETTKKLKELISAEKAGGGSMNGSSTSPATAPPQVKDLLPPVNGSASNGATANGAAKTTDLSTAMGSVYDRRNPYPSRVLDIRQLNKEDSEKDVRFISLDLKGSGLTYEVGDSLGVYPENCPEIVEGILKALSASGEEPVVTPEGFVVPARIALMNAYVITETSDALLSLLAHCAGDESEAERLENLAMDDPEGFLEHHDVLDLLNAFPSARTDVREIVPTLSPLRPRLYSISSSLKAHPDQVHLTVGVVRYTHEGTGRLKKGVASTFLAERLQPGHKAGIFVQHSHGFRPPANGDTPMIMIGPGTGIAPFRAFLAERGATGATGKNWLFFGDQHRHCDFLYEEELEGYLQSGLLTRLDCAFSRDQTEKIYVQHKMLENAAEIWSWLQEGGHIYVCGDASRMARDVDAALHQIVASQGKLDEAGVKAYVADLAKGKRYQRDVY